MDALSVVICSMIIMSALWVWYCGHVVTWSLLLFASAGRLDNGAELLFREMKDRDGDSYEALIQGLVKVRESKGTVVVEGVVIPLYLAQELQEGI